MTRPAFSRRGLHADSLPGHLNDGAGGRSPQDRRNRLPPRKGTGCRWTHVLLGGLVLVVLAFFGLGIWQLTLMTSAGGPGEFVSRIGGGGRRARPVGSVLRFVPSDLMRRFEEQRSALDRRRSDGRLGLRPPRLALVSVFESSCLARFSLLSGKAPYRPVHTGPAVDRYADRSLPLKSTVDG
ncbi:hypothetical protein B296_00019657 [Ensete ventricosum]|uniref:Uncharacterized protein n=1 Tax=Ensete ventricosum TaxID=4639 RepID=A0A427B2D0_ENSVE|nr:hypothetical protein B296_00019657 [Ensete ventricosum]